jgi:hypothetical protein
MDKTLFDTYYRIAVRAEGMGGQGVRTTPGSMNIVQLKLLALYRKA